MDEDSRLEKPWFIFFYVDWCTTCKNVFKEWEKLAQDMKGKINVGAVDCEYNYFLRDRFLVRGYPSIIFFDKEG